MSPFVGYGKDITQHIFLVVKENIGLAGKRTTAECSTALALVLIAIYPTILCQSVGDSVDILASQWSESFPDQCYSFLIGGLACYTLYQRDIDIPMGELVQAKEFCPHPVVAMEGRECLMYSFDQVVIH